MKVLFLDDGLNLNKDDLFYHLADEYPEIDFLFVKSLDDIKDVHYWNTLLVYRFNVDDLSKESESLILSYKKFTAGKGSIFPVSYGDNKVPPGILKSIKANDIGADNSLNIIGKRVGAFLGLTCIGKDHQIFLSHRALDGRALTMKIEAILQSRGFRTWRDEAKDLDQEGAIAIGKEAQTEIQTNLENCSAIILIDTPRVTESDWVYKEIEMANAQLIPILPICFRYGDDDSKGPRFKVLRNLDRWLEIKDEIFTHEEITNYLEKYLLDIYKRKRELPVAIEKTFLGLGYSWNSLDSRKSYFHSFKPLQKLIKNVLSHSPIHKGLYPPYVQQFSTYQLSGPINFNYRLLVYDGEVKLPVELDDIKKETGVNNVEILHHQDLELFIGQL